MLALHHRHATGPPRETPRIVRRVQFAAEFDAPPVAGRQRRRHRRQLLEQCQVGGRTDVGQREVPGRKPVEQASRNRHRGGGRLRLERCGVAHTEPARNNAGLLAGRRREQDEPDARGGSGRSPCCCRSRRARPRRSCRTAAAASAPAAVGRQSPGNDEAEAPAFACQSKRSLDEQLEEVAVAVSLRAIQAGGAREPCSNAASRRASARVASSSCRRAPCPTAGCRRPRRSRHRDAARRPRRRTPPGTRASSGRTAVPRLPLDRPRATGPRRGPAASGGRAAPHRPPRRRRRRPRRRSVERQAAPEVGNGLPRRHGRIGASQDRQRRSFSRTTSRLSSGRDATRSRAGSTARSAGPAPSSSNSGSTACP